MWQSLTVRTPAAPTAGWSQMWTRRGEPAMARRSRSNLVTSSCHSSRGRSTPSWWRPSCLRLTSTRCTGPRATSFTSAPTLLVRLVSHVCYTFEFWGTKQHDWNGCHDELELHSNICTCGWSCKFGCCYSLCVMLVEYLEVSLLRSWFWVYRDQGFSIVGASELAGSGSCYNVVTDHIPVWQKACFLLYIVKKKIVHF